MVFKVFRNGGSIWSDLIVAAAVLAVVLVAMAIATSTAWYPIDAGGYVGVAVLSAAAWPASRLFPRTTLLMLAVIVTFPLWAFDVTEVRVLPLVIAGFRAAVGGVSVPFVVSVCGGGAVLAVYSDLVRIVIVGGWEMAALIIWLDPSRRILVLVVIAVVLALGYLIHALRTTADHLRERNAQLLVLQEGERERVTAETRTAIARDIHDVVAHHMTAIVIRAQAAESTPDRDPDRMYEAMHAISEEGSEALAAMRRAVRVLRNGEHRQSDAPARTFHEMVEEMVGRVRANGRDVVVTGAPSAAPEFVQVAVLGIVQEALTNVMLHSDARTVRVEFTATEQEVGVRVTDDGREKAQLGLGSGGNGILGMRERTSALGGLFFAGPVHAGGWAVRADIPRSGQRSQL